MIASLAEGREEVAGGKGLSPQSAGVADPEVVARVLAGETALFEVVMRRYNRRLFRVVWSILLDEGEAEDVVQDAYVRAYQHLNQFDGRAPFATWLTKIAVYEASARRKRRRRQVPLEALAPPEKEALMAESAKAPASGEDRMLTRDLRNLLERAVAALPSPYRQVFVLREVEELSTEETAQVLGVSRTAAKVRLFRAKRLLRGEVERLLGAGARQLLAFAGERCDRTVARVLARLAKLRLEPTS